MGSARAGNQGVARNSSARSRSTETNRETPRSDMVTPNSRSILAIVIRWCVITGSSDSAIRHFFQHGASRSTLASSRARRLRPARKWGRDWFGKRRTAWESAVGACSPPDNGTAVAYACGGLASFGPVSSGSSASVNFNIAAPPKSRVNNSWKRHRPWRRGKAIAISRFNSAYRVVFDGKGRSSRSVQRPSSRSFISAASRSALSSPAPLFPVWSGARFARRLPAREVPVFVQAGHRERSSGAQSSFSATRSRIVRARACLFDRAFGRSVSLA